MSIDLTIFSSCYKIYFIAVTFLSSLLCIGFFHLKSDITIKNANTISMDKLTENNVFVNIDIFKEKSQIHDDVQIETKNILFMIPGIGRNDQLKYVNNSVHKIFHSFYAEKQSNDENDSDQ